MPGGDAQLSLVRKVGMILRTIVRRDKKGSRFASQPLIILERETALESTVFVAAVRFYGRPGATWMLKNTAKYPL